MKKHIAFWIVFPITFILLLLFVLFYFDLSNGPIVYFILELVALGLYAFASIFLMNRRKLIRFIPIAGVLVITILMMLLSHPKKEIIPAVSGSKVIETDVLKLKNGDIRGLYNEDKDVEVYAGIPYAKAPIGDLRWKEPQEMEPWDGVLDCTSFAPISYQAEKNSIMNSLVDIYAEKGWHPNYTSIPDQYMSEDSLYLNIWRPKNITTNLPILVYIHGGSLTGGNSNSLDYNGEAMARQGVIMITIAYRLGIFGYFAHEDLKKESLNGTTGNYGLLDQIQALKWVNENASYFGGDKDNITIAGESAGSSSVSAICVSPLAKGLFKRAIGESSSIVGKYPPHTFRSYKDACNMGVNIMKEMGVNSISELRNLPAERLMKSSYVNSMMTIDGYAITKSPYQVYLDHENNEEALLNGYNVLEADAFVIPTMLFDLPNINNIHKKLEEYFDTKLADDILNLYKKEMEEDAFGLFNRIISMYWFYMPHYEWSTLAFNNGEDVYRYQFTKDNGYYGTYHSGEIIYAYGNIDKSIHGFAYNESDYELSNRMLTYFSNFVKFGNPNGEGLIEWKKWDKVQNNMLELGSEIKEIEEKYVPAYNIIQEWNERTKQAL